MNKNRIRLLASAFSAIIVISFFNFVSSPHAEALQYGTTNVNSGYSVVGLKYIPFGVHNYAVDVETKSSPTNFIARVIDTNTTNTVSVLNLNSSLNLVGAGSTPYTFDNISCDVTGSGLCALGFSISNTVQRVVMFDAINNVASTLSTGANTSSTSSISAIAVAFSHGSVQSTIFMGFNDNSGTNHFKITSWVMNNTQGVQNIQNRLVAGGTFQSALVGFSPNNGVLGSVPLGANSGNYVAWTSSGGIFALYKASSNVDQCNVNIGGSNGDTDFVNLGTTGNYWLTTGRTTNNIKQVDFGCNVLTTITAGGAVNSISHSPSRNEFYYQSSSAIFVGNLTSLSSTTITSYTVGANTGQGYGDMITNDQNTISGTTGLFVGAGLSTSNVKWVYWGTIGSGSGTGGTGNPQTVCFDVNPTGSSANLVCITCPSSFGSAGAVSASCPHGFPSPNGGSANIPPAFRGSLNGTQQLNAYGCSLGWFSCTNTNTQTNGTGLAFLILLIVITTIIILYATYRTGHEMDNVGFPIILCDLLWCAVTWQTNLTSSLPFFVGVLVLGGFTGAKIYARISGGAPA